VNIVIFTDTLRRQKAITSTTVSITVRLPKRCSARGKNQRYTVEALAADIAALCLEEKGVEGVRAGGEAGAVRFSRSVGVEIERHKTR
jgi:hypothetical protein